MKILTVIGAIAMVVLAFPLVGFLFGAFAGAIAGFIFDDTFREFFNNFLKLNLTPWQIGGLLGFIGGFFRTTCSK